MEPTTNPQHFLLLNRGPNKTITVNLTKPVGHVTPLYSISHNVHKMSSMEIRRTNCDAVFTEEQPVGAVKLRTIPPRVDVTVRGVSFKMARKHPLSNALAFRFLGAPEMRWEQIGKREGSGSRLVDFNGKIQAHFRPRMHVVSYVDGGGGSREEDDDDEKNGRPGQRGPGQKNNTCSNSNSNTWNNNKSERGPGFELYGTRLADLDLDLIITTGLAAAEYRRQLDDDLG